MSTGGVTEPTATVLARKPVNAWLLVGDDASYPSAADLAAMRVEAVSTSTWTAPSQAQPGDLLFFYFMAPRKQVLFAARAASHAFPDSSISVNALKELDAHQWWVTHTPMVEIPAVTFAELKQAMGGHLILKGKPTHYLRPEVVRRLVDGIREQEPGRREIADVAGVLQFPTGNPDLPPPTTSSLAEWSQIADGALTLEAMVEEHVVEPLLRLALGERPGVSWTRQHQTGDAGVADWVVLSSDVLTGVVESKVGIAEPRNGRWNASPHFVQLTRYMDRLRVPGLLIDSKRMFLVDPGAGTPRRELSRVAMTADDLRLVGDHLTGGGVA